MTASVKTLFALITITAAGVMSILVAQPVDARRSNAYIEQNLTYGIATAYNWDQECFDNMSSRGRNANFNSGGGGTLRDIINTGSSYKGNVWLSKRGQGNATMPITVPYGTTSIPLQINDAIFLCGPLVSRDLNGTNTSCSTSIYGRNILFEGGRVSPRWVPSVSNANDRPANDFGGGCMHPAKAFQRTRIKALSVVAPSTIPGSVTGGINSEMTTWRDADSRYWFGNLVYINFVASSPITSSGVVNINMSYKKFSGYHTSDMIKATKNCDTGGPRGVTNAPLDIERCGVETTPLRIAVLIEKDYELTPAIRISQPTLPSTGGTEVVYPSVKNDGKVVSDSIQWELTRLVVGPSGSLSQRSGSNAPCSQFIGYQAGTCASFRSGNQALPSGITNLGPYADILGALEPGSKICYVMSVQPGSFNDSSWRHSAPACADVVVQPTVHILGNDLRVGSGYTQTDNLSSKIVGTVSTHNGSGAMKSYGSWGEYGVLAPGVVDKVSSGSGFSNGASSVAPDTWSKLTFANNGGVGCTYGCFSAQSQLGVIPNIAGYFSPSAAPAGVTVSTVPSGSTIGAQTINSARVIRSSGTVTIDGDITYQPGATDGASLPQLIIIANTINITSTVKHIDAWLVATGSDGVINTCSDGPTQLTIDTCNIPLEINGPVTAKRLLMRRTATGDARTAPDQAAETINMRADAYIWSAEMIRRNGAVQTVYTRELPPRF